MNMVKMWLLLRLSIIGSILMATLGVVYRCSKEAKTWKDAVHYCGAIGFKGEILHVSVTNNKALTPNGFEELTKTLNVSEGEEVWFGNYVTIGTGYSPPSNNLTPISTNDHICGAVTWIPDGKGGLKTSRPRYQDCDTKLPFLCGYTGLSFQYELPLSTVERNSNHGEMKTWNDARHACGTYPLYTPRDVHIPTTTSAHTSVLYWVNKVRTVEWQTYDRAITDPSLVRVLCGSVVYNSTTPRLASCNDKKRFVCSFRNDGVDAYFPSYFSKSCKFESHEKTSPSWVTQTTDIQGPTPSEQPHQQFSTSNSLRNSTTIADAVLTTRFSKTNAETAAETSHLAAYVGIGSGVFIIICIGLGILLFVRNRRRKDKRSSNQYVDTNVHVPEGTGQTSEVQYINVTFDSLPEDEHPYAVLDDQVNVKEYDQTSHYYDRVEMNAEQELQPSIGDIRDIQHLCSHWRRGFEPCNNS